MTQLLTYKHTGAKITPNHKMGREISERAHRVRGVHFQDACEILEKPRAPEILQNFGLLVLASNLLCSTTQRFGSNCPKRTWHNCSWNVPTFGDLLMICRTWTRQRETGHTSWISQFKRWVRKPSVESVWNNTLTFEHIICLQWPDHHNFFQNLLLRCHFLSIVVMRFRTWVEAGLPFGCPEKQIFFVSNLFRFVIYFTDTAQLHSQHALHLHCYQVFD